MLDLTKFQEGLCRSNWRGSRKVIKKVTFVSRKGKNDQSKIHRYSTITDAEGQIISNKGTFNSVKRHRCFKGFKTTEKTQNSVIRRPMLPLREQIQ